LAVFILAPLIIRGIWDTVPLPAGEVRRHLTQLCRDHRVRVRDLLLWRTFGGTINGAVMGFFAPVRYILLTDALLDLLPKNQIEAVMVHELAHVRKHHMFWLLVSGFGTITLLLGVFLPALVYAHRGLIRAAPMAHIPMPAIGETGLSIAAAALTCLCGAWIFGWISRRFERQADSFAVQHLAHQAGWQVGGNGGLVVDPESAAVMAQALQSVADLNHMSVTRSSWRHGSIRWRQEYLYGLVGQPADRLAIDRLVGRIKIAALLAAVAGLLLIIFAPDSVPL
jgi:STE24 endopeptidase